MTAATTIPPLPAPMEGPSREADLRNRVRELEDALHALRAGELDAFLVRGGVATSERALSAANRLRQGALEQMRDAVLAFDAAGHVVYLNPAAERQYRCPSVEALGRKREAIYQELPDPAGTQAASPHCTAHVHALRDGRTIYVESNVSPLLLDGTGEFLGTVEVVRDVSERRRAEALRDALASLGDRLREADSALEADAAGQQALVAALGGNQSSRSSELAFRRDVADRTRSAVERIAAVDALRHSEARLREANGRLTDAVRRRTNDLTAAEEALRQAQKMEAVGQLTGGLAHDFNNLLASISGSLQVLRAKLGQGKTQDCERYIHMGLESVKRAAALTQRLLAFARRQTLDPKPTDVNQLITGIEDLLRRTVGPDVFVEVLAPAGVWTARIDPPQLENALLNLCINGRDAMLPGGGRLVIRTANECLDSTLAAARELPPGEYVTMSVTDTGSGMSPELIARIFDPFFTTKPLGHGTGLGLSMVHGFVNQSGGHVRVFSEVGKGTTMRLYLPRHHGEGPQSQAEVLSPAAESGRGETVLLVEDQDSIRIVLAEVLEGAGYHVIASADGRCALEVLQGPGRIDLLITDVGLPGGMNGRQVADAGRVCRPELKVLFITGYAESAAVRNGQLESGMEILTKPFDLASLTRRVRGMIH
jgi:PAS domain S-box-containing protein